MNRLILVLVIGLLVCNSAVNKQNATSGNARSDSVTMPAKQAKHTDCACGVAVPIVKKAVFPQTTFVLQPDSLTGIETVAFDNGDNLTIKNRGCEYYILTFRFETSRLQQDTANLHFWFKGAASLMTAIVGGLEAPIDLSKGIDKLMACVDSNQDLKLGEEIDFGAGDIRSFVTVDSIEKLADKKYAVEISFATGPL